MKNIVVVDLNVFVKALLGSKTNRAIYETIKAEKFILALSPDLLRNLAEVLIRPHLKLELKDVKRLLDTIKEKAIIVKPQVKVDICRDASDNVILETAVSAKADIIVTNDKDLLVLESFRSVPIIRPEEFLKCLEQ